MPIYGNNGGGRWVVGGGGGKGKEKAHRAARYESNPK